MSSPHKNIRNCRQLRIPGKRRNVMNRIGRTLFANTLVVVFILCVSGCESTIHQIATEKKEIISSSDYDDYRDNAPMPERIVNPKITDEQEVISSNDDAGNRVDAPVPVSRYSEIDWNSFLSNTDLSTQENEEVKKHIVSTLSYIFMLDIEYEDILSAISVDESTAWVGEYWYYEEQVRTILDVICFLREAETDYKLTHIDADFMVKPSNTIEEDTLHISAPIYIDLESSEDPGGSRTLFDFYLKSINGKYKIIGIVVGV